MPFLRHFTMNIVYSGLIIIVLGEEGMSEEIMEKIIQGMNS